MLSRLTRHSAYSEVMFCPPFKHYPFTRGLAYTLYHEADDFTLTSPRCIYLKNLITYFYSGDEIKFQGL